MPAVCPLFPTAGLHAQAKPELTGRRRRNCTSKFLGLQGPTRGRFPQTNPTDRPWLKPHERFPLPARTKPRLRTEAAERTRRPAMRREYTQANSQAQARANPSPSNVTTAPDRPDEPEPPPPGRNEPDHPAQGPLPRRCIPHERFHRRHERTRKRPPPAKRTRAPPSLRETRLDAPAAARDAGPDAREETHR
jgi:hypothetical protein